MGIEDLNDCNKLSTTNRITISIFIVGIAISLISIYTYFNVEIAKLNTEVANIKKDITTDRQVNTDAIKVLNEKMDKVLYILINK